MKRLNCLLLIAVLGFGMLPRAAAAEPEYKGKSWCLMDAATGTVLLAYNEHAPLPPASVTKIMTLLLIMEAIDSGTIGWSDPVTASETAAAKGGSQIYLKVGETMTVEDMVKSIAVSSANDCACAMAELLAGSEAAFAEKMNARAAELGMNDTHFVNCTGLDDGPEAANHKTSAYDIALMSRQLLTFHPDIKKYTTIWMDSVRGGAFGLSNTNKLVRFYQGATGLKTGFTSSAGYCLSASAMRDGMELIAVVMGCETSADRFNTCRGMLDYGFAGYGLYTPVLEQQPTVPVTLGDASFVCARPAALSPILAPRSELGQFSLELSMEPELSAPVEQGRQIGVLTVLKNGSPVCQIPMLACETVHRLRFSDLFRQILGKVVGAG